MAADGACRLTVESVGAFFVDPDARHVVVDPLSTAGRRAVRLSLLGNVATILQYKRGLLPLHASAVRMGDRIIAFSGDSGAGKSTLAAAMLARGHALAADDVTAVDVRAGVATAWPAFPRLRLTRASIDGLKLPLPSSAPDRVDGKHACVVEQFASAPAILGGIYFLRRVASAHEEGIETPETLIAVADLAAAVHRRRIGTMLVGGPAISSAVARLAVAVPVYVLALTAEFPALERLAELLDARERTPSL